MVELQISMIPNTIMGPIVASEASTQIFNKLDNPDETFIKTQIPVEVSNVTIQKLDPSFPHSCLCIRQLIFTLAVSSENETAHSIIIFWSDSLPRWQPFLAWSRRNWSSQTIRAINYQP